MVVQKLTSSVKSFLPYLLNKNSITKHSNYNPTFFLKHHVLQSIYQLGSPQIKVQFDRERVYFTDGGHISLDWSNRIKADAGKPIILIMHGMTGGSQTKYIKALVQKATQNDYCSVCLNSRGINSEMTSPIPFVGVEFHQIQTAIQRIKVYYPNNPMYIIGTSLGGNYVLRYLFSHKAPKIKGLALISPPFDVKYVINEGMNIHYQKMFIKYYLQNTILKHEKMKFWWESGIVDLQNLKKSTNMKQFHDRITIQIMGCNNSDQLFDNYKITDQQIQKLSTKTFILAAKDDPMVCYSTIPQHSIKKNKNIQLMTTQKGGHLCWFQGFLPKRWYPKPVFDFINNIEKESKASHLI